MAASGPWQKIDCCICLPSGPAHLATYSGFTHLRLPAGEHLTARGASCLRDAIAIEVGQPTIDSCGARSPPQKIYLRGLISRAFRNQKPAVVFWPTLGTQQAFNQNASERERRSIATEFIEGIISRRITWQCKFVDVNFNAKA
jgi:hypothetical protein